MSLTGFLKTTIVQEEFRRRFPLPQLKVNRRHLHRVHQSDAALVGTATDWLIRMKIAATHSNVRCSWLTTEILQAVERLCPDKLSLVNSLVDDLFITFKEVLNGDPMNVWHARACVAWATAERVYRGNDRYGKNIGQFLEADVVDTFEIGNRYKPQYLQFAGDVFLNPGFGLASVGIGGADADVVARSRTGAWGLVDFKSTRYLEPKIEDFHQLIGYSILNEWSGRFPSLTDGCVLFTRFGTFLRYDISGLFGMSDYENFMNWFLILAQQYSGNRVFPGTLRRPTVPL
jgi:hypothetical protein